MVPSTYNYRLNLQIETVPYDKVITDRLVQVAGRD